MSQAAHTASVHPLRLLPRPAPAQPVYNPQPIARRPPPVSTAPEGAADLPSEDSGLWTDSPARLAPALAHEGGGALCAARQLLAFLLDGAADADAPITVHLPGSHDGAYAWQLWQNLLDEAGELGVPPAVFRLYHALPHVAEQNDIAELIQQGHWQIADGDVAPQAGRHAALIAHGHYSRRPAKIAWNHYGEAWQARVAMTEDGPRWRLTPRADYPAEPIKIAVGGPLPQPELPPLFDDAADQALAERQQGRADCGVAALPVTLFAHLDALAAAHPDGVLVHLADLAYAAAPPQTLPAELDAALPLNAEAIVRRHPALRALWRAGEQAALLHGVLQDGHAPWPLTRLAAQAWQADALFGDEAASLAAVQRAGCNPRYLARHMEELEKQEIDPAQRAAWLAALEQAWQRARPGEAHTFSLGCLAMRFAHYGVARAAFLGALPQAANPAPALHNLALLEMLTGDAPRAEDILAALEAVEPDHPKTRRLRARINDWQSRFAARLGWDPARARCDGTGLALSPLMPHHARELAWACRDVHDMALTRLPDLADVDAATAWISEEAADPAALPLALLHPALGLVGFIVLRAGAEGGEVIVCTFVAPAWRGRGWMAIALGLLDGEFESEVWRGNVRSGRVMRREWCDARP
nr:hypothetical protein [Chromobacterium sp. ASV5]